MCPSSNVQTGAAPSIERHPLRLLRQLQFRVTVNTDNRLMSQVTLSSEFELLAREFGYGWSDIEWLTINAMKSAFAPFDERLLLINTVIKPGFATARATEQRPRPPAPALARRTMRHPAGRGGGLCARHRWLRPCRWRRDLERDDLVIRRGHALRQLEQADVPVGDHAELAGLLCRLWLATSISVAPMMYLAEASVHSTADRPSLQAPRYWYRTRTGLPVRTEYAVNSSPPFAQPALVPEPPDRPY